MGRDEALRLLQDASEVYIAKGRQVIHINFRKKDAPDRNTVATMMLGPTGNLRAPTLRVGKKLLVGFHPETYQTLVG